KMLLEGPKNIAFIDFLYRVKYENKEVGISFDFIKNSLNKYIPFYVRDRMETVRNWDELFQVYDRFKYKIEKNINFEKIKINKNFKKEVSNNVECFICKGNHYASACEKKLTRQNDTTFVKNVGKSERKVNMIKNKLNFKIQENPKDSQMKYLDVKINDSSYKALVDTGASHNFISDSVVKKEHLQITDKIYEVFTATDKKTMTGEIAGDLTLNGEK
ncbi:hypothetical protein H311_04811, partial [Anncaliia algerae PRA109]